MFATQFQILGEIEVCLRLSFSFIHYHALASREAFSVFAKSSQISINVFRYQS